MRESDLIKIAVAPNYQIPGDAYGRYPVQFLANISQAFFAVDGHGGLLRYRFFTSGEEIRDYCNTWKDKSGA